MPKKIYIAIYENKDYKFETWTECKEFVENKKNIIYRGFTNTQDAQEFIFKNIKRDIPFDLKDVLYMYVDGSFGYQKNDKVYGWGICGVKNEKVIYQNCGADKEADALKSNQIAGELKAALIAIEDAIKMNEPRVILVYDYMGIEMWANGSWKPKEDKPFVLDYVKKIKSFSKRINIDFKHINSHINDGSIGSTFNNIADGLAKEGIRKAG